MGNDNLMPSGGNPLWPVSEQPRGQQLALPQGQESYFGPKADREINLATLWRVLHQWRWIILGCLTLGVAGAVIATLLMTPVYRSTAVLELNPPAVQVMDEAESSGAPANDSGFLATQYGLLGSRSLAQRVAQELNLASDESVVPAELPAAARQRYAVGLLASNLEVEPLPASRLVRIAYSSEDPALAARVVNGFAEAFINSGLERRYEASSYARDFLERQIGTLKGELEADERQLVAYAQRQGLVSAGGGGGEGAGQATGSTSLTGASLAALNQALAEAQTRRIAAEQRYRQAATTATTAEVSERTAALRAQKAELEAEYEGKLATFQPSYPDMVRLRSRIAALENAIRNEASNVTSSRSNTLRADYQAALAEQRALESRVAQLKGAVLDERGRSIEYNILQRELDTSRSLYDALLQRYRQIGVAGGIGTAQATIVDRGQVPGSPYKPNLILNILIGLALGLIVGVGTALILEFLNDTIKTPDDVRDKLGLPSLGVIPTKKASHSMAEELKEQGSAVAEAYYSLRTSLQFATETGAPKLLLVTSTRAAEGKSSTTLALAQNFARLGSRVLLIDADLRKPAFVTDTEGGGGLSNLLTNRDPVSKHVVKVGGDTLWLLPCGPLPPNPAELLASKRLQAVLSEAEAEFDMVIVDGPPVLGLADAPLLGAICRGTLMVIESGKTRTPAAREALGRLRASGSQVVGAVLTRYRHQSASYGYSYEPYRYGGVGSREREIRLLEHSDG